MKHTILGMLLAGACASAMASEASVAFTNLTYSVIDLTPWDGIAPSYEILPAGLSTSSDILAQRQVTQDPVVWQRVDGTAQQVDGWMAPISSSLSGASWAAQTSVTPGSISASVTGQFPLTSPGTFARVTTGTLAQGLGVRLGPNTGLYIFGDLNMKVDAACAAESASLGCRSGYAMFSMSAYSTDSKSPVTTFQQYVNSYGPVESYSGLGVMSLFNYNNTARTQNVRFEAVASFGPIQAIPEPSTWALVLAGLLSLAIIRRHARQRHSAKAIVGAALAVTAAGAMAQTATSLSRLSNIGYTVVDLMPSDGIAPGFEILPGFDAFISPSELNTTLLGYADDYSSRTEEKQSILGYLPAFHSDRSGEGWTAHIASNGRELEVSATSDVAGHDYVVSQAGIDMPFYIRLAPHTSLVMTAKAEMHTTSKCTALGAFYDCGWGGAEFRTESFTSSPNFATTSVNGDSGSGNQADFTGPAGFSLTNLTGEYQKTRVYISLWASATTQHSPIPEPSVTGMAIVGLGVLWISRRRRVAH